jgi:hypothetical protein
MVDGQVAEECLVDEPLDEDDEVAIERWTRLR